MLKVKLSNFVIRGFFVMKKIFITRLVIGWEEDSADQNISIQNLGSGGDLNRPQEVLWAARLARYC